MWCRRCGQDVPGVVSLDRGQYRCPRCATSLRAIADSAVGNGGTEATEDGFIEEVSKVTVPLFDSWEMDERLRHIERVLYARQSVGNRATHTGHPPGGRPHFTMLRRAERRPARMERVGGRLLRLTAGVVLSLGLMGLSCGLVLLAWSAFGERHDLWTLAMTVTLTGQSGMLIGALLQVWQLRRFPSPRVESERCSVPLSDNATACGTDKAGFDDPLAA